jgi:predicted DCC family thiol-disulfide oxidoreductase YuxK
VTDPHHLLWDGDCGICSRSITWFSRFIDTAAVQPLAFQMADDELCPPALRAACERSIQLRRPDGTSVGSIRAISETLRLSGHTRVAWLMVAPGVRWCLEAGYWLFARNRVRVSRLLGQPVCAVPTRERSDP